MSLLCCRVSTATVAMALSAAIAVGQTATPLVSEESRQGTQVQGDGLRTQEKTIFRMFTQSDLIDDYVRGRGQRPENLRAPGPYLTPVTPADSTVDGWGRPFGYYSSGDDYALLSYGRDGLPDLHASALPSGYTCQLDLDADIVILNGEWAQFPAGLGRPF